MKNDGVHDPVNRVCYMLEPRGDDAIVHVRLDPGGGLRPHGPPAIESAARSMLPPMAVGCSFPAMS